MGAIKSNPYNFHETTVSLLARAVAHPARVKILGILTEVSAGCTNRDLAKWLNFSKANVKNHLDMMKDAEIIEVHYCVHYYSVELNEKGQALANIIFATTETNL